MSKFSPGRIARGLWRRTGHKFIRKVEMDIMRRPMSLPNFELPANRRSPVKDADPNRDDYMWQCEHKHVDSLAGKFSPAKLKHFHNVVDNPNIDFVIRIREDGECWGYMMHALSAFKDPLYHMTVPILEDETYQFDGWVHPDYRGKLIAIEGTNWVFNRRRADGTKGVVVTVRKRDKVAQKYHKRFGFVPIGEVVHWRVGPLRFNSIKMDRSLVQDPEPQPEASTAPSAQSTAAAQ